MKQMFVTAALCQIIGFVLLFVTFLTVSRDPREYGPWVVFSFVGAWPLAGIGALFTAFHLVREELRETRRELKHWQSIESYVEPESSSTGIKPAPPSGHL